MHSRAFVEKIANSSSQDTSGATLGQRGSNQDSTQHVHQNGSGTEYLSGTSRPSEPWSVIPAATRTGWLRLDQLPAAVGVAPRLRGIARRLSWPHVMAQNAARFESPPALDFGSSKVKRVPEPVAVGDIYRLQFEESGKQAACLNGAMAFSLQIVDEPPLSIDDRLAA
jgi:hypothetical protein